MVNKQKKYIEQYFEKCADNIIINEMRYTANILFVFINVKIIRTELSE